VEEVVTYCKLLSPDLPRGLNKIMKTLVCPKQASGLRIKHGTSLYTEEILTT
jgi:hypothetical protein